MILLTLAEIAAAVGGRLDAAPDPRVRVTAEVELDSRRVTPGGLFVALRGQRSDGHDHVGDAVRAGAVAVLATRPVGAPAILVPDVSQALGRLAAAVLHRLPDLTVVGVTGSSGKTSTKDLLAQLLARLGPTVAPPGSFNNELGHPYTVLRSTAQTRYLVLEYSSRGVGHIAALCRIAPPRLAAVLNVGSAHLGEFGSRAAIAAAKGELVEALPPAAQGGVAVLNADDPLVLAMAERTAARVVRVGESTLADLRAVDVRLDERGRASYELLGRTGDAVPVRLGLYGAQHVPNSLAAAAIAVELGMGLPQVAAGLAEARLLSRWRMEVTERPDGVLLVNDAYNANPESMRAALEALMTMARGRRSWAVLGEMAELGASGPEEHAALGRLAMRLGVDRLVVVGPGAAGIHCGAREGRDRGPDGGRPGWWAQQADPGSGASAAKPAERPNRRESVHVPDVGAAVELLRRALRPGDVVLVKASRAAGLEQVALALAGPEPAARPTADPDDAS